MAYKSKYTGVQIDQKLDKVAELEQKIDNAGGGGRSRYPNSLWRGR